MLLFRLATAYQYYTPLHILTQHSHPHWEHLQWINPTPSTVDAELHLLYNTANSSNNIKVKPSMKHPKN